MDIELSKRCCVVNYSIAEPDPVPGCLTTSDIGPATNFVQFCDGNIPSKAMAQLTVR